MASRILVVAASLVVALPAYASQPDFSPVTVAPAGNAWTKYCLHVDPITGSLVETVQCWTREQWAEQGVDVDKEWAKEGVNVVG